MPKLFILDASGYLYRSYFAIRNMTNGQGQSTNALFGFIRSYLKLCKDFGPEHIVSVFDGPQNALSRETVYADYKAHRQKMPPDLAYQIDWARQFCDLMGIANLSVPGVEADDTMGSIALWAEKNGYEVLLCTSDKDLAQLVTDKIKILNTFKENLVIGPREAEEIYGVRPEQMIDFLAITGDASDNVPGIPGFGPKTAVELIKEFGTLENLLNNVDKVKSAKKQEVIVQHKESALMSRKLVEIHTQVEFPKDVNFFLLKEPHTEPLKEFYTYMHFNSLVKELKEEKKEEAPVHYHLVNDEEAFRELVKKIAEAQEVAFDTETTSEEPMKAELVGLGFGFKEHEAWYVPLNGVLQDVLGRLKPLFEDSKRAFFGHNIKYDYHVLLNHGIEIKNISFDTMLASYVLHANERRHNLDYLALNLFGKVKTPISDLIGKGKHQIGMKEVEIAKVSEYGCEDVDYTFRLKNRFQEELKKRELERLYYDVEIPLVKVLARMERKGIFLNQGLIEEYGKEIQVDLRRLSMAIYELAGEEFNINSPKQLSQILFTKMGIKPPRRTATGHSTDSDVLEMLRWDYPIAEKLLEYRTLEKLRSTYIEKLPTEILPKTGRIHCTFNQTVAATGRLSCQDPNLQNIPIRTEAGRKIREAFRPGKEGWSYVSGDYSQIELRLLAHLSEDPTLIQAFHDNQDIHASTASRIFNIPLEEVSKDLRYKAKAVNFGIIYGQGEFGLSQNLGISRKEAKEFIERYFERYPQVKEFIQACKEEAVKTGKATTLTGRQREIPEIHSKNMQIRAAAERLAINTPLQGTAADLIKIAMLKIDEELEKKKSDGAMILQIHDELVFECPDSEIPYFKEIVPRLMSQVFTLKVPLVVDISVGKNWKEC